jgi:heme-degrading monooxygenase HmoA
LEREFERAYGPAGEWKRLFERGDGYRGTELLRDIAKARRYVTVDRWESREAFETFHERYREEYEALDAKLEALTEYEARVGWFEVPS